MDLITSLSSQAINKALDGLSKRHEAIAGNLANVDTPGYQRHDVSFEAALQQAVENARGQGQARLRAASNDQPLAMRATDSRHFAIGQTAASVDAIQPEVIESEDVRYRNDGNAVDVETEMVQLAKNTQKYVALSNLESRYFKGLHTVINGGGG